MPAAVAVLMLACEGDVVPVAPSRPAAAAVGIDRSHGGSVVFADDFESGTLASWPDGVDPALHRIVTDPEHAVSGSRYLAVSFPEGRDGGWLTAFFMPGYDALRVSYHVRFPGGWRGSTKLIGFYGSRVDDQWSALGQAGQCPTGSDFFAAMLVTGQTGDPGEPRFYTYYPEMSREPDGRTCWGRFGDGTEQYHPHTPLTTDRWHHIEFEVRLNTQNARDGSQLFRVDRQLRGAWRDLSFGDTSILRLNAVQLTFSVSSGTPRSQELHVDNLVVRTVN